MRLIFLRVQRDFFSIFRLNVLFSNKYSFYKNFSLHYIYYIIMQISKSSAID